MELAAASARNLIHQADSICVGASPAVNRNPLSLPADRPAADVLSVLLEQHLWGAPVLDGAGRYVGMCSLRRIAAVALPVAAENARSVQSLGYLREGVEELAARIGTIASLRASDLLDTTAPVIRGTQSLPQAMLLLVRQAPVAAVLDDVDDRLIGTIALDGVLRALHERSGLRAAKRA